MKPSVCTLVGMVLLAGAVWAGSDTGLFEAIRANDEEAVASLLGKGADANGRNPQGATALMYAALHAGPAVMKLLLEKEADPNARNQTGATALMWAAGDPVKTRLLIEKGANVNARANSGRTPLIIAAAYPGNLQTVRLLLAKGADPKTSDETGDGPLGNAASSADVDMLKELLAAGASVSERGNRGPAMRGMTPLIRAANANCVECVRLLLARGSDVNAVSAEARTVKAGLQDLGNLTPLLMAAGWGNPDLIQPLLEKGASLEARDSRGFTALMLAVTNEHQDARSVRLLLDKGAKADVLANDDQSALSWARKWGPDTEIVRLIAGHGGKPDQKAPYLSAKPEGPKPSAAEAVEHGIVLLQASNAIFFEKSGCVSCHHQILSGILAGAARDRGLRVDGKLAEEQLKAGVIVLQPRRESLLQRVPQGGAPLANAIFLVALGAQKYPPDALTDALVHDLAGLQRVDGSWFGMQQRPPMEFNSITETAWAVRALDLYSSPGRRAEMRSRVARARDWLLSATPRNTEEHVMQLLGIHWAGAKPRPEMAAALIRAQGSDGGWAQRPDFPSDAYATGEALYALNQAAGVAVTDPLFRRGVEYLLGTQYKDGSWYVRSRSVKFQPYFQSGFPHEHDQWISAAGTCWAALALTLAVEPPGSTQAPLIAR